MIPIIDKLTGSCETKENLSEIAFLAGFLITLYGTYKAVKSIDVQTRSSSLTAAAAGGLFMLASLDLRSKSCKYAYNE